MISRKRGMKSVAVLVDKGWITPDQGKFYESTVEEGVSFRTMAMGSWARSRVSFTCARKRPSFAS